MAAYPHHATLPPTDAISVTYSENEEEEVDQLDSDFDDEIPVGGASSSKTKRARRRSGERLPGQTLLPSSKLESIMHSDGMWSARGVLLSNKDVQVLRPLRTTCLGKLCSCYPSPRYV
jgi:hypothetical protein